MQECFRKYPEIYGAELAESEADEEGQPAFDSAPAAEGTPIPEKSSTPISEREQSAAGSESVSETPQDSELSPEVSEKPATSAKVEAPGPSAS
jgi:intermembrane space import and assembly protein 40